jgi:hypothetical protein
VNALSLAGGAVVMLGLALCLLHLGAAANAWRRSRDQRATAAESAPPGARPPARISANLAAALASLGLSVVGAPVLVAGLELRYAYSNVDEPRPIAWLRASPTYHGIFLIDYRDEALTSSRLQLTGSYWSVSGDYIVFDPALKALGLGTYQRVIELQGFANQLDGLMKRPMSRERLRDTSLTWSWLDRHARSQRLVRTARLTSPLCAADDELRVLSAGSDGYVVASKGTLNR